jgi:hypothetical protein
MSQDPEQRSPSEPYPGPEPDAGGQPPTAPSSPGEPDSRERAAETGGDDVAHAGDAVASFGPLPDRAAEPDGPRDMAEKHRSVQSRERIDLPPPGQPEGQPGPEWAIADHEAESDPEPDPGRMPSPLTHDDGGEPGPA